MHNFFYLKSRKSATLGIFLLLFFLSFTAFSKTTKQDSICKACFLSAHKYFYSYPDSALYYSQIMKNRAIQINDKKCLAIAFSNYGTIYRNSGKYSKSLIAFDSSLTLFKELKDSIWEARTILMIGSVYSEKGDHLKCIELLMESSKKYEGLSDEVSVNNRSIVKNHIGSAYYELGEQEKALSYFEKALEDSKLLKDTSSFVSSLSNIAMIQNELGQHDSALVNYTTALEIAKNDENELNVAQTLGSIGYTYELKGDFESSIRYRMNALTKVKILGQKDEISKQYYCLANSYYELNQLNQASKFADSSYTLSKQIQAKTQVKNALELMIDIQLALNKTAEVIPYYKELILYKDSILTQEKVTKIAKLEVAFETENKELIIDNQKNELDLLKKEKQLSKIYSIGFIILFILILVILFLLYSRQKLKASNAAIKEKLTQKQLQESKFQNNSLLKDLAIHQQEIASITLSMIRKNEQIEILKEQISKLDQNDSEIIELNRKVREHEIADIDWNNFNDHFSKVHPNFYENLLQKNKDITQSEMRTAALLKMNLSTREIASITGVNIRSVDQTKYRLKKKIAKNSEDSLVELIRSI